MNPLKLFFIPEKNSISIKGDFPPSPRNLHLKRTKNLKNTQENARVGIDETYPGFLFHPNETES